MRHFCLLPEFQKPGRFDLQHGGDVEQQIQGDGAADIGGLHAAHVLAADAQTPLVRSRGFIWWAETGKVGI